jgi:predicted transglutaminase-like cysteine proteinase
MRRVASCLYFVGYAAFAVALIGFSKADAQAQSQAPRRTAALAAGASTSAPIGWVQFCNDNPADCRQRPGTARSVTLTPAVFAQLAKINLQINRDIEQVSDLDHFGVEEFWTYPVDGKGDCEDLVLEKKRRLIEMGLPREALLITVVRDLNGDGHAILTVVTDRGDYVLDNFSNEVKLWHETGYRFIKRQAQVDANQWVSLNGGGSSPVQVALPRR